MITKPKPKPTADAFIAGAPDATAASSLVEKAPSKHVKKGNKFQITLTINPDTLEQVDEFVKNNGMTRAGFINMAIKRLIRDEKDGSGLGM